MALGSLLLTLNDLKLYKLENITNLDPTFLMTCVFFISFIYFVADTLLMIKHYAPRHNIYFFHHLLAIISLPISYFLKWQYARYVMYYMTFELSTPVYNLTYELHKRGYTSADPIFFICQWIFVGIFVSIRVIFGSYTTVTLVYEIFKDEGFSNYCMILPISLQSLMYYWFMGILDKINTSDLQTSGDAQK